MRHTKARQRAASASDVRQAPKASSCATASTSAPGTATSPTDAVREWEARARLHFKETAVALEKISQSSNAEDEAGLRSGCQQLHDTNSIGLQDDLPTPDRELTKEIQQMIDDMDTASHACMRFALARDPVDADNYQAYLARAVEHLHRAKAILTALTR